MDLKQLWNKIIDYFERAYFPFVLADPNKQDKGIYFPKKSENSLLSLLNYFGKKKTIEFLRAADLI